MLLTVRLGKARAKARPWLRCHQRNCRSSTAERGYFRSRRPGVGPPAIQFSWRDRSMMVTLLPETVWRRSWTTASMSPVEPVSMTKVAERASGLSL